MVDFGSGQGRSDFEAAGVVRYVEDFKRVRTPAWAKRCLLWMGTKLPISALRLYPRHCGVPMYTSFLGFCKPHLECFTKPIKF
jgi:hypothetical protein